MTPDGQAITTAHRGKLARNIIARAMGRRYGAGARFVPSEDTAFAPNPYKGRFSGLVIDRHGNEVATSIRIRVE